MDYWLFAANRANKRRGEPNNAVVNGTCKEIASGDELRKQYSLRSSW
jgi:hypothetical protein